MPRGKLVNLLIQERKPFLNTISKSDRLVEAANEMFYQQGVTRTTLADIAQQADVPLGNVYYHFRTKRALIGAVIQDHLRDHQAFLARLALNPDR